MKPPWKNIFVTTLLTTVIYLLLSDISSSFHQLSAVPFNNTVMPVYKVNEMDNTNKSELRQNTTINVISAAPVDPARKFLTNNKTLFSSNERHIDGSKSNEDFERYSSSRVKSDADKGLNKSFYPDFIHHNSQLCANRAIRLLIYIYSSVGNVGRRQAIRQTWGNTKLFREKNTTTKIVFIMGYNYYFTVKREEINKELEEFGDLVIGNFHDTYKNLIYKGLTAIKWINLFCNNVDYVLKTDDDVFLNIFGVASYLLAYDQLPSKKPKTVFCHRMTGAEIDRNPSSRWFVDKSIFPGKVYYPRYCIGLIYMYTKDIIEDLYNFCQDPGLFTVEDVFFTQIVMGQIPGINWIWLNEWAESYMDISARIMSTDPSEPVIAHGFTSGRIVELWNTLTLKVNTTKTLSVLQ